MKLTTKNIQNAVYCSRWNDIGHKDKIVGNIHTTNSINNIVLSKYLVDADVFNDKYCTSCKHLYICGGGCASKRLTEIDKPKKRSYHIFKNHLPELLDLHYENI